MSSIEFNPNKDSIAYNLPQIGKQGGKKQGAFLAQISSDDFMKKGYVAPPGLTEGGSCFKQV